MTLGPLLMAASCGDDVASDVGVSRGLAPDGWGNLRWLLSGIEFLLLAWAISALYKYVPYTQVRWSHAWVGGLWVATATEVARNVLTYYFGKMPTFSVVYGAFATVPILLVWIYLAWTIVLIGAVLGGQFAEFAQWHMRVRAAVWDGVFNWRWRCCSNSMWRATHLTHGLSLLQLCELLKARPLAT